MTQTFEKKKGCRKGGSQNNKKESLTPEERIPLRVLSMMEVICLVLNLWSQTTKPIYENIFMDIVIVQKLNLRKLYLLSILT